MTGSSTGAPDRGGGDHYRELFLHAPIGQAVYDLDGCIVEANESLHRMLGYADGELVGRHVLDVTHPDDASVTRYHLGRAAREETDGYTLDKRYVRKDGSTVWGRINTVTVRDVDGEPLYYAGLVTDLTERREREQLLRLAEQQLREVFAHAPIGLAVLEDGRVIDANPELSRILGRGLGALVDRTLDSFRPPEDLVMAPEDVGALTAGRVPTLELSRRFVRPEGAIVHTRVTMTLLPLPAGEAPRVVALVEDVTEQRRAEWERALAERRYRTMFEDAAIGQVITTLSGSVVDANPTFCRLVGRDRGEVEGASLASFAHPDEASISGDVLRGLLFGDISAYTREQRFVRPDGTVVHTELHVAMGPGASGGPEHLVVQVGDVTERRQAEQRLAETLARLEERNQDLEHFASVASHDLKSPLQTILGFLELLLLDGTHELSEQQRRYVERAITGGHRMRGLIDAVLNFARSGTQALEIERVAVARAAAEVERALDSNLTERGGRIEVTADGVVLADPSALEIVLQNLVGNALKFASGDVAPHVRISSTREHDRVVVRIADNGRGIPQDQREEVFEMFSRGQGVGSVTGSGIGLTTCRRLVERMHGSIWFEDSDLGGVAVAVSLPAPSGG